MLAFEEDRLVRDRARKTRKGEKRWEIDRKREMTGRRRWQKPHRYSEWNKRTIRKCEVNEKSTGSKRRNSPSEEETMRRERTTNENRGLR